MYQNYFADINTSSIIFLVKNFLWKFRYETGIFVVVHSKVQSVYKKANIKSLVEFEYTYLICFLFKVLHNINMYKESLILEDRVQFVFITVIAKMKKRRKNSSRMGLFATNDVKDSSEVRFSFVLN
jgi:hypothetical protein